MWNVTGGSWGGDEFRMASGAEIVGGDGDSFEMKVSIPSDEDGFFGRQCPSCRQIFRIDGDDYEALPDEVVLWCVYCGHHDEHSEFMTQQQLDRALRAAGDLGVQIIGQTLDQAFSGLRSARRPSRRSGFGIEISYRTEPFYPEPLPGIDEEKLIRIRSCERCSLRYAVFGEHRFCPVCGQLPAMVVALDALAAETARLDGVAQLPAQTAATLREQGVFTRLWVDTLENLVGVVEALGSAVFCDAVPDADQRLKGKGNIFQRLDHTADLRGSRLSQPAHGGRSRQVAAADRVLGGAACVHPQRRAGRREVPDEGAYQHNADRSAAHDHRASLPSSHRRHRGPVPRRRRADRLLNADLNSADS